ncbi:MAG: LamB/YcsF family protein, partial [Candidatus Bathyarchaeia archaeon]|nr:LamB/YcsF family protein [Candidatus Bathyarchaeia archaeon]
MKLKIDINCDLGESYGTFKVGNDEKITVNLAKKYGVAVGAHPGYPD